MAGRFVLSAEILLRSPNTAQIESVRRKIEQQLAGRAVTVPVRVQVNQAQLTQAQAKLNSITKATNTSGTAARGASKSFTALASSLGATIAVGSAVAAVFGKIREGIAGAVKFSDEYLKLLQTTGKSPQALKGLERQAFRLGQTYGVAADEVLNAARTFQQAGLSIIDTQKAVDAVIKASVGPSFGSTNEIVETSIALFGQFGITSDNLKDKLSQLAAVSDAYAVESSDLSSAIRRAGGAYASSGDSLEDLVAQFTRVREASREGAEQISTGLRTINTRLQRQTTQKKLGDLLNISLIRTQEEATKANKAVGTFIGTTETYKRVAEKLAKLPGGGEGGPLRAQVLEIIAGAREARIAIPILEDFARVEEIRQKAIQGSNKIEEQAKQKAEALLTAFRGLKEEVVEMFSAFGDNENIQALGREFIQLSKTVIKFGNDFNKALNSIKLPDFLQNDLGGILPENFKGGAAKLGIGGALLAFANSPVAKAAGPVGKVAGFGAKAAAFVGGTSLAASGLNDTTGTKMGEPIVEAVVTASAIAGIAKWLSSKAAGIGGAGKAVTIPGLIMRGGLKGLAKGGALAGAGYVVDSYGEELAKQEGPTGVGRSTAYASKFGSSILKGAGYGLVAGPKGAVLGGAASGLSTLGDLRKGNLANEVETMLQQASFEPALAQFKKIVSDSVTAGGPKTADDFKALKQALTKVKTFAPDNAGREEINSLRPEFEKFARNLAEASLSFEDFQNRGGDFANVMVDMTNGMEVTEKTFGKMKGAVEGQFSVQDKLFSSAQQLAQEFLRLSDVVRQQEEVQKGIAQGAARLSTGSLDLSTVSFNKLLGGNAEGIDQAKGSINEIVRQIGLGANPVNLTDKLPPSIRDRFDETIGSFGRNGELKQIARDRPQEIAAGLFESIKPEDDALEAARSSKRNTFEALARSFESPRAFQLNSDRAKAQALRGDPSKAIFGTTIGPQALGGSIQKTESQLTELFDKIAKSGGETPQLIQQRELLVTKLARESQALDLLANSTLDLSKKQADLAKMEDTANREFGFLEQGLVNPGGQQEALRLANATAADPTFFNRLDNRSKGDVLSTLQQLGDNPTQLLNGANPMDIRRQLVKSQTGIDPLANVNVAKTALELEQQRNDTLRTAATLEQARLDGLRAEISTRQALLNVMNASNPTQPQRTLAQTAQVGPNGVPTNPLQAINILGLEKFQAAVSGLSRAAELLNGLSMEHTVKASVEVIINGDAALGRLEQNFGELVIGKISDALSAWNKKAFQGQMPDIDFKNAGQARKNNKR